MNPSQFAATTILPLLARIVLALAFLPQGWNNLMVITEFTAQDAQRLREMGVRGLSDPDPAPANIALGAVRGGEAWSPLDPFTETSAVQTDSASDAGTRTPPARTAASDGAAGTRTPPTSLPSPPASPAAPARTATPDAAVPRGAANDAATALAPARQETASPLAPLKERGLYRLALAADAARLPAPIALAWGVAAVQLLGGGCILLGVFSRLWGLLMAVILVGVFVTGTLPSVRGTWFFGMSGAEFNLVFAQMALFVLALGVFLVGPGALSLDRAIFRRGRSARRAAARASERHAG